jgi:uncharacterized oligopeptide transporter (OPT) family protein
MYFGLTTGFVTMASIQAAVLGHAVFLLKTPQQFPCRLRGAPLSVAETVVLQTVSVAAATMPLAAGFVGILPALTMLTPAETEGRSTSLSVGQQFAWTLALVFFGIFLAIPLRKKLILVDQLRFPSGTATAAAIRALNTSRNSEPNPSDADSSGDADAELPPPCKASPRSVRATDVPSASLSSDASLSNDVSLSSETAVSAPSSSLRIAGFALAVSAAYTVLVFFVPVLSAVPVFGLAGGASAGATAWGWTLSLSPSGIGQGMIMGWHTCVELR